MMCRGQKRLRNVPTLVPTTLATGCVPESVPTRKTPVIDRHLDLRSADIGSLNPPSGRRMIDISDKREPGLNLRLTSKSKSKDGTERAWTWRYWNDPGKQPRQPRMPLGHWP